MLFRLLLFFPLFIFAEMGFNDPWGKDADLSQPIKQKETYKESFIGKIADSLIQFHQDVISPIDGPRSHFRPTSSKYMQLAIRRYGFFKGVMMGCDRLLRENNEKWIYPTITINNAKYKFDPAIEEKSR